MRCNTLQIVPPPAVPAPAAQVPPPPSPSQGEPPKKGFNSLSTGKQAAIILVCGLVGLAIFNAVTGQGSNVFSSSTSTHSSNADTAFCSDLGYLRDEVAQQANGTMTDDEAVKAMSDRQSGFEADASLYSEEGNAPMSGVATALALAAGHEKVAYSNGELGLEQAVQEMSAAVNAIPLAYCP